ncbi:MAG: HDOD domain-containing protein, partial [Deltaproteobacteria bacterium]|nr:HDOD domain-containing protein [Deltaproteobacteria bacterium]
ISVRLITISNSATYRGTDKIQTVKQAVPRLGMKQSQSVVTAIASKGMYDVENEQFKEVLRKLWMHALATAYAARNLAVRVGLDDVEMLFLMGLVHDIGKVLLLKPLSELMDKAEVINMDEALTTIQVSHAHLGGSLLERLGFSQEVVRTTTMHNAKKFSDATQREILAVNLANLLAHKLGYTIWDEEEVELEQLESAKILALAPQALTDVCGEVKKIMDDAAQSF